GTGRAAPLGGDRTPGLAALPARAVGDLRQPGPVPALRGRALPDPGRRVAGSSASAPARSDARGSRRGARREIVLVSLSRQNDAIDRARPLRFAVEAPP